MSNVLEFIKECQEKVFSGIGISSDDAEKLFNISDENIPELAKAANGWFILLSSNQKPV